MPGRLVFIDKDGEKAIQAAAIAAKLGIKKVGYLEGGIRAFREELANIPKVDTNSLDFNKIAEWRFKLTAQAKLDEIAKKIADKKKAPAGKKVKPNQGC